jgi:adenosylcobinamide kinase / adenosylcobinamide-phosphate guanylyltransferase
MKELILGGQKSGKSGLAERRASDWLSESSQEAILIVTALAYDAEMTERIARHQAGRRERIPRLNVIESANNVATLIKQYSTVRTLIIVDCLTLWLTQLWLPPEGVPGAASDIQSEADALCSAISAATGPVILIANEIGMGVTPMGRDARHMVDELGRLNQRIAQVVDTVTLMVAGCEVTVRGPRHD